VVRPQGNPTAIALLQEVFLSGDQPWRGIGVLTGGGLSLRDPYTGLDARRRFGLQAPATASTDASPSSETVCIAGSILRGRALPTDCPAFGLACTPEHPLGAPMVSSEGACAAYFHYRAG
jgi:hydrogenase expression/formation protein HypD